MKELDLRKIEDCRFYLENFSIETAEGHTMRISSAQLQDGRTIEFKDLSDGEVVQYANQLFHDLDLPSRKARMN